MQKRAVQAGEFAKIYDPSAGEDTPWYINDHTIFKDASGTWHLIGITHAEPANPLNEKHFAHATAPALYGPWSKQPFALSTDPSCGETHLWAPHVIAPGHLYHMFYSAGGETNQTYRIHLATSTDAQTWTRHPANPLVVDGFDARDPMVLHVDGRWIMYYTATETPAGGHHIVAACESDDLVHWRGRHTVYTSPLRGTFGGPTESPFVVARNDRYYLFCGSTPEYADTSVFISDDPLLFEHPRKVGHIKAHALEVVTDDDGRDYVTHCGWGQGGVYLAPLHWDD